MDKAVQGPVRVPDPRELFDRGLEFFARGRVEDSVTALRQAFFGNLYIAPALLGIEVEEADLWAPTAASSVSVARQYAEHRRVAWQAVPDSLRYLRCLWDDPLVRREIHSYTNFCKSFSRAHRLSDRVARQLLGEWEKFTNERRIRSTQREILRRVRRFSFAVPPAAPRLTALRLAVPDPKGTASFLAQAFGVTPEPIENTETYRIVFERTVLVLQPGTGEHRSVELTLSVAEFPSLCRHLEDAGIKVLSGETTLRRGAYLLLEAPGGLRLRVEPAGE